MDQDDLDVNLDKEDYEDGDCRDDSFVDDRDAYPDRRDYSDDDDYGY